MRDFHFAALTPPNLIDPAIAIAASHAGAIGVLDLAYAHAEHTALAAMAKLVRYANGACGLKLDARSSHLIESLLPQLPDQIQWVILTPVEADRLTSHVRALRARKITILLETISIGEARLGEQLKVDGLIAKGHESGGRIGEETTFILLQRLLAHTSLPIWAQGGIGLHSAAACYTAGAAGIVLDAQLLLTRESPLPEAARAVIARMDGSETIDLGGELGEAFRVYARPNLAVIDELRESIADTSHARHAAVRARIGWGNPDRYLWPIGQDAAFAAPLAAKYHTVGGVITALRESIDDHLRLAQALKPLAEGSPLARSHGTRYPIVQGPMTRVSDRPAFALQVADGGALPFLALALMRKDEVARLLEDTRDTLGDRPWGVGILGFVPLDVRQEQMEAIRAHPPAFALIAGGRPDQALWLEQANIPTYLHVPSPGLLQLFVANGARRFVFEGRECGGHVGPRTSFVLWNTMIDTLLECVPPDQLERCHVLFAGGIHDALSASMVATMAAPLAERGVKIGVLLGTAYLFTQEVVASGAIVEGFQHAAIACERTVLLESGSGHATRCAATPFTQIFQHEKHRLIAAGRSGEELRVALEELNLGRLRIASKGINRHPQFGHDPTASKYTALDGEDQQREGLYMIGQVAVLRNAACTIAQLHQAVSSESTERLVNIVALSPDRAEKTERPCDIAIIGMSALLPKAPNLQAYWENILNKVDAITEVPPERWDWRRYYDPDPKSPDKVYSKWGGFIDNVAFDPTRYGIPPSALPSIEPLQLLMLEAVRAALEDAGYADRSFNRKRAAVILGVGGGIADLGQQYAVRSALPMLMDDVPMSALDQLATWTEDSFPGILLNVVAGRVANRFDLGGVNFTVDAACASSLAAVYLATRELEAGTSDMVIVGGGDTVQNPFAFLCFSKTQALSPRGRCSPFDASADGIAISEGLAILVLKRLADAERDGDRVYAVIKGVGGSSDGRDKSLTAPRPEGQALALERAYTQAGFSPATVELIEAHGTGTVVGDQAEVATLQQVLSTAGAMPHSCAIGSVKSMIGHTKSTAGAAGLAKIALALHHQVLPPTINVTQPNPRANFADSPLYVNTEARPWLNSTDHPRRAGVSAFGFGGTNFHAVLEEYTGDYLSSRAVSNEWAGEVLLWSGNTRAEITSALQQLDRSLAQGAQPPLRDLAYTTWQMARDQSHLRLAIVATSINDLREKLAIAIEALNRPERTSISDARGVFFADEPLARTGQIAFLLPGQGSQYLDMLRDLAVYFPEVRDQFELADRVLRDRLPQPLSTYIFPPPGFSLEEQQARQQVLTQTNIAQPALGAASLGLVQLLKNLGIEPDMTAGHSYGEYVALCIADVFDQATLYTLSEARGRCIIEAAGDDLGAMAAVVAHQARVAEILQSTEGVWIANVNAPRQTVISGTRPGIDAAIEKLNQHGIQAQRLPVACAFHSPVIGAARDRLAAVLASIEFHAPRFDVYSNAHAAPYARDPHTISEWLAQHLVSPVRFGDEVQAMHDAGARVFIEVGPRNVLTRLVDQILEKQPYIAIATDVPDRSGVLQLLDALAQLAAHGAAINLDRLYAGRSVRRLNLDALEDDLRQPTLPSTTWLVNGGRARPLHEMSKPAAVSNKPQDHQPTDRSSAHPSTPRLTPPAPNVVQSKDARAASPSSDEAGRVMLQFQQLMNRFLDTQQQVMQAYLQGSNNQPASPSPDGHEKPLEARVPVGVFGSNRADVVEETSKTPNSRTAETALTDNAESIAQQLIALVSERTGYPPSMLKLNLNIESDLGIDSIKRIEILGAFQRACTPDDQLKLQAAMDTLAGLKTLGHIVESIGAIMRGDESDQLTNDVDHTAPLPRFLLKVVDAPLPEAVIEFAANDFFLITDDERGVASALARSLRSSGARVVVVRTGHANGDSEGDVYAANLIDAIAVDNLLHEIHARYAASITGFIHLLPLAQPSHVDEQARLDLELKSLFNLTQALSRDFKQSNGPHLIAATAMGGAFASGGDRLDFLAGQGAIAGFVKALAQDWPHVQCRVIDLDADESAAMSAERLMAEITTRDELIEIGYSGSRRVALRAEPEPLIDDDLTPALLDADSVVLLTGGARGLTAEIARELAARYQPTLVLVGRTELSNEAEPPETSGLTDPKALKAALIDQLQRTGQTVTPAQIEARYTRVLHEREVNRNLAELTRHGAKVFYYPVDVRDDLAFEKLIDQVYASFGRIDAVIHGAGVIEDKLIEDKTPSSFARVFDTKMRSAFTLARKLRSDSLKVLVFFSSVAGRFGNRGQTDYAAANEVLNKLAVSLDRQWPGRVVSINWGPWAQAGMATPEVQRQLIERGMTVIDPIAGRRAFDRELRSGRKGEVEVILGDGFWAAAHDLNLERQRGI